jgi:hypothetical protein
MAHKGGVQIAAGVTQIYPQPSAQFPCGQKRDSYGPQEGWVHIGRFGTDGGNEGKPRSPSGEESGVNRLGK